MSARKRYCMLKSCGNFKGTTDKSVHMFKWPSDPKIKQKWIDAIQAANNSECTGRESNFVCSLHFSDEAFESNDRLVKEAVPTEFWVELLEPIAEDLDFDDTTDIDIDVDFQLKYNELRQLYSKNQMERNVREASLREKNAALERKVQMQSDEIHKLQKKLAAAQVQTDRLKSKLVQAQTSTNIKDQKMKQLIQCLLNGVNHREKYPEVVRDFCLMIHFLSVRAYEAIREFFGNNLPHPGTLRAWYSNSDLNCKPGISHSCLQILKKKALQKKAAGSELVVSVIFDEMHIRKMFQWCNSSRTMLGHTTFGTNKNDEGKTISPAASQVIVFMAIGVNEKIKLPFAYHFIKSLTAEDRKCLLGQVIDALIDTGVKIACVTFDGLVANRKMCKLLGANLNISSPEFKPYFKAKNGDKIHIMLDTPHMEKLVRGALGKLKVFYDASSSKIEWRYYEELLKYNKRGFGLTHKLNQNHINFDKRKMKVNLAVQLFSGSTADSIEYLMKENYIDFKDASATVAWTRMMDKLFDIFNSKSDQHENKFKRAICPANKHEIFAYLRYAIHSIKNLTFKEETGEVKKLIHSSLQTGFRGFIINCFSVRSIYKEFVEEKKILDYVPTYPLNQDSVEILFSKTRSLNGYNDNPSSQQFQSAYRKLLVHSTVCTSKDANNYNFDTAPESFSDILFVSSRRVKIQLEAEENEPIPEELNVVHEKLAEIEKMQNCAFIDSGLTDLTIAHISNVIESRILRRMYCDGCKNVFAENLKVQRAFTNSQFPNKPCLSTFSICKEVDRFIKMQLLNGDINFNLIYYAIFEQINVENLYEQTDFTHEPNHKFALIRGITDLYIQIKGTYIAKEATFDMHPNPLRLKFKKLLHVYGQ